MLTGLSQINLELSSVCNKSCFMCGRRKRDKLYGDQNYGFMDFKIVKTIASQLPEGLFIALHNNGEGMLYPELASAIKVFKNQGCYTYMVSNGKLLMEKYNDIVNNLDCISISIIENEIPDEKKFQYETLIKFLEKKGSLKPLTILRYVGNIEDEEIYNKLNLPVVRRILHAPEGSFNYTKKPTIPEHGTCQDFLNRLAIDRYGYVSCCVRYDINGDLRLGKIPENTIDECWNSIKRKEMWKLHTSGKRCEIPFCNKCEYFGVPTGN